MIENRFIAIVICCIISLLGSSCISANVPPSSFPSTSNWRRRHNEDDIPIMGNGRRRQLNKNNNKRNSKRNSRRRRRKRKDDDEPPFILLNEDSDDDNGHQRHRHEQYKRKHRNSKQQPQPIDSVRQYITDKTGMQIPNIDINFDPITIIKLRKSWSNIIPFGVIRIGADFETHRLSGGGLWRIRGCIEDTLLGGRFTVKERRRLSRDDDDDDDDDDRAVLLEYTKSWLFAGGGSIGTRFNLCAAYDITTHRTSARFGFRTENTLNTFGTYHMLPGQRKGFTIIPIIPLDNDRRLLLEAKTNIDLPEPEFVIGTSDFDAISGDTGGLELGIGGDIDVDVEEVNLIFSF